MLLVHARVTSQILNHLSLVLCSRHHPLLPPPFHLIFCFPNYSLSGRFYSGCAVYRKPLPGAWLSNPSLPHKAWPHPWWSVSAGAAPAPVVSQTLPQPPCEKSKGHPRTGSKTFCLSDTWPSVPAAQKQDGESKGRDSHRGHCCASGT